MPNLATSTAAIVYYQKTHTSTQVSNFSASAGTKRNFPWILLEWVIPPTYRLGSSVGERLACHGVVPGSIPGLAYSFLFYRFVVLRRPLLFDRLPQSQTFD